MSKTASLTLLGLVGLIDPPRPEAVQAIAECKAAGIDVKMITGDHASTGAAIARELGLGHWLRRRADRPRHRYDGRCRASPLAADDVRLRPHQPRA